MRQDDAAPWGVRLDAHRPLHLANDCRTVCAYEADGCAAYASGVAPRSRSFRYLDLHDEQFEELTFLLGQLEHPKLIRPRAPDLGLDAVELGKEGAPAPRGFQAKHFTTGSPSWSACRDSLDAAVKNYSVEHLTFTFPRDLTGKQIARFNDVLAKRHLDITVDYWGASQLTARLLASEAGERIARHAFGDDDYERLSRLFKAGQDLDTPSQAISVLSATGNLFKGDPYFDYSIGTRPLSAPPAAPGAGTVMRLEVTDENGVHSIDARATAAAIGADHLPKGTMHLEGQEAARRLQEFMREGGELTLEGVRMEWEQQPKHFADLLGAVTDESTIVLRSEHSAPGRELRIELETTTGRASVDVGMQPSIPPDGWDMALVGAVGGTEMRLAVRRRGETGELRLNWSWRMSASQFVEEQLLSLRLLRAAAGVGELRVVDVESGETLAVAASPAQPFDPALETLERVLSDIAAVESWLGARIDVPEEITGADATSLRRVAELITGVEGTWSAANFVLNHDADPAQIPTGGLLQMRRSVSVDLFGRRYELGDETTYMEGVKVASSQKVPGGRKFTLEPITGEARVLTRLESAANMEPRTDNGPA